DSGGNAIASGLSTSSYLDGTAENGTTYYYRVAAVDTNGNVSARSTQVSATPTADGVVLEGYEKWLSDNGVTASDANFYEYAMGGDPTDGQPPADKPVLIRSGGSYYYVYPKRSDDAALTYTVEITTNLLDSESWMDAGYSVTGTDVTGGIIDFVTNAVDTVDSETFIRLRIER
ncbi:MAG TPA: hypothetical protein VJ904_04480, partial [Tichowtungia sp.]|nr:hypothetical protein [Tichowtungia sp.]